MRETRANETLLSLARAFGAFPLRMAPFASIGVWALVAAIAYAVWSAGAAFGWLAAVPIVLVALGLVFATISLVRVLTMLALGAGLKRSLSHLVSLRSMAKEGAFASDSKRHLPFLSRWNAERQKGDVTYPNWMSLFVEAVIILVCILVATRSADAQISAACQVVAAAAFAVLAMALTPYIFMDGRENPSAKFVRKLQAKVSPLQRAVSELAELEKRSVNVSQWPPVAADRIIAASINRLPLRGLRQRALLSAWHGDANGALEAIEQSLRTAPTSEFDRATRLVQAAHFAVEAFNDPGTARELLAIAEAGTAYLDDWTYAEVVRLEIDVAEGNWASVLKGVRDLRSRKIVAVSGERLADMESQALDALAVGGIGDLAPQPG